MKLKTLKDLGFKRNDFGMRVVFIAELREEAIRWVKHYRKSQMFIPIANGFMDFFNITESDLTEMKGEELR